MLDGCTTNYAWYIVLILNRIWVVFRFIWHWIHFLINVMLPWLLDSLTSQQINITLKHHLCSLVCSVTESLSSIMVEIEYRDIDIFVFLRLVILYCLSFLTYAIILCCPCYMAYYLPIFILSIHFRQFSFFEITKDIQSNNNNNIVLSMLYLSLQRYFPCQHVDRTQIAY
jgi:hypothetical protein